MRSKTRARRRVTDKQAPRSPMDIGEAMTRASRRVMDKQAPRTPLDMQEATKLKRKSRRNEKEKQENERPLLVPKRLWSSAPKMLLYSKPDCITVLREYLSPNLLEQFQRSCLGHLLNLKVTKFPSQLMLQLLRRQCQQDKDDELCFNIGGNIIRFRLKDFALITGLNCGKLPFIGKGRLPNGQLLTKYFDNAKAVSRKNLNIAFNAMRRADDEDKLKMAKLYCLENVLLPRQECIRINLDHMNMLDDNQMFDTYPWGRLSYEITIEYVKKFLNSPGATGNAIGGFPLALIIWAYEVIPTLSPDFNTYARRVGDGIPRICNWESNIQPKWRELQSSVFESKQLEVKELVPTEEELKAPFMESFKKEKRTSKKQKEFESSSSDDPEADSYDSLMLTLPQSLDNGNKKESEEMKKLFAKFEILEKEQNWMNLKVDEIHKMLGELTDHLLKDGGQKKEEEEVDESDASKNKEKEDKEEDEDVNDDGKNDGKDNDGSKEGGGTESKDVDCDKGTEESQNQEQTGEADNVEISVLRTEEQNDKNVSTTATNIQDNVESSETRTEEQSNKNVSITTTDIQDNVESSEMRTEEQNEKIVSITTTDIVQDNVERSEMMTKEQNDKSVSITTAITQVNTTSKRRIDEIGDDVRDESVGKRQARPGTAAEEKATRAASW